jgi:Zn-finger nucleic acid-binding protein
MAEPEPRWPCPVCLGVTMKKAPVGPGGGAPYVDCCTRCGGLWFELGEVELARQQTPDALSAYVARHPGPARTQCHACHGLMTRDAPCPHCGHAPAIDCPSCARTLEVVEHAGMVLDACRHCRGIWFDRHELSLIWEHERSAAIDRLRRRGRLTPEAEHRSVALLEGLWYVPDLAFYGAYAGVEAVSSAAQAAGSAPEVVEAALEASGEAAASVFEVVVAIVGGIFS